MRREHHPLAHRLDSRVVRETSFAHRDADPLQREEAGVALVEVEHVDVEAEGAQRPIAADAEQELLSDPLLGAAAVEPVGDELVGRLVAVDLAVEEVQRHTADASLPDARRAPPSPPGRP